MRKVPSEQEYIELYREYAPKLFTYCWSRVKRREDAEDLAAQVFTKTWDYLAAGNTINNMRAFMYRSAHNLVVDFYKTSKADREISVQRFDEDTVDIPAEAKFDERLEVKMEMDEVKTYLQELPDDYRELITLRYLQELEIPEIAEATGMTKNNVSVKLHRAMKTIKSLVMKHEA